MAKPVPKEMARRAGVLRDSKEIVITVGSQATAPNGAKLAKEAEVAR